MKPVKSYVLKASVIALKVSAMICMPAVILFAITSCDNATNINPNTDGVHNDKDQPEADASFAVTVAEAGIFEVEMGKLAEMKGTSEQVKELGRMLVNDHKKANDELKALAVKKSITLPTTMGDEKQKEYDMLAAEAGNEFDKKYSDMMVEGHKKVIDEFKKEADSGMDSDISEWAKEKIPVLEHHLQMSESTCEAMKTKPN